MGRFLSVFLAEYFIVGEFGPRIVLILMSELRTLSRAGSAGASLLLWPHTDSNSSRAEPTGEIWPLETSLVFRLNQHHLYTENVCKAKVLRKGEAWPE